MKIYFYFGFMLLSLIISNTCGIYGFRKIQKVTKAIVISILTNLLVLSIASGWWFIIESDGFSQVFGVLYYTLAFIFISVINIVLLIYLKKRTIKGR